jgi:hypothetical protein
MSAPKRNARPAPATPELNLDVTQQIDAPLADALRRQDEPTLTQIGFEDEDFDGLDNRAARR